MPSTLAPSDLQIFSATYYDGETAVRHDVAVHLCASALDIISSSGEVLDQWPYGDVSFADQGSGGIRVGKIDSEARLVFQDDKAFAALRARAPAIHAQKNRARHNMYKTIVGTAAFLGGFYLAMPYLTALVVALTPLSYEAKLGRNLSATIIELFVDNDAKGVCSGVEGGMVLAKVVKDLSQHKTVSMPYEVRVLDVDMVNAMALPGGYIYVFRGLLDKAEGPAELAGVLAHEMAHVDLRHPMNAMVRSYGIEFLSDMMFGGSTLGGVSGTLMSMSYSRDAEQEADENAIQTLDRAGFDTLGMAQFFERLSGMEDKSGLGLPGFLSTHPDSGARSRSARSASHGGRDVLNDEEWAALRAICT
ncbi:MAG: M48 family metallopeptidase [Magnetovibrio sp.]|nr:M48 family metallopeptidase [Magnetovibrio sp.]